MSSPHQLFALTLHDRPNHVFSFFAPLVGVCTRWVGCGWKIILQGFCFMNCLYSQNTQLFIKKKGINDYAAQCCAVADVPSSTRIPFAPSTLSEPTATLRCCAVRFTWLENGNTMNQRLYVQRPSVLTGCFIWLIMQRGKKTKASHTNTPLYPQPYSSETLMLQTNADGIRDNFLRKWILQMFSGFLLCWRGAVGRLVRCVSAPSLPPVYSCISIACFLTRS